MYDESIIIRVTMYCAFVVDSLHQIGSSTTVMGVETRNNNCCDVIVCARDFNKFIEIATWES